MSTEKPRKRAAKKVAAEGKAPRAKRVASVVAEATVAAEPKSALGKALVAALEAFKGQRTPLANYLGMKPTNLTRAFRESAQHDAGTRKTLTIPAQHYVRLAKVSGMQPHEFAPDVYEPNWKVKRVRPKLVEGSWQTE